MARAGLIDCRLAEGGIATSPFVGFGRVAPLRGLDRRSRPVTARRSTRSLTALLAVLAVSVLAGCSTAATPVCADGSQAGTAPGSYALASGDQLQVIVFRHPDLSGEFALDGEGYLALPLVGDIAANGLSTRQLGSEIEIRLRAGGFLVAPQVGVQLVTHRSFYVIGEIGTPGSYEYRDGISVTNAVALAGGYTYRADQSSVTIGRGSCRFASKADTSVEPGDIITIAERFF